MAERKSFKSASWRSLALLLLTALSVPVATIILSIPVPAMAAAEYSIGVSPPIVDAGDFNPGETRIVKFFIVTPSTEPLLVYLEGEQGRTDFFTSRDSYKPLIANMSEQNIVSWLEFLRNPTEIRPLNESVRTQGGSLAGWEEVSFLINVPKDAEPGYHLVRVTPYPTTPSENLGPVGARMVAVTAISILFNVRGPALRQGVILDVTAGKFTGRQLEIDTYFKNTGTDTITAKAMQDITLNGSVVGSISSSGDPVKPGETKILRTYLPESSITSGMLESGSYVSNTNVSYISGSVTKVSALRFGAAPSETQAQDQGEFPWWIMAVVAAVVIVAVLIYRWK
jgi:hypothetical protein